MIVTDLDRVKPKHPTQKLHITLPVPPSVNKMYYNTRYGGRRLTAVAQDYMKNGKANTLMQVRESNWVKPNKRTWLYCDMVFYFPDRKVRDAHNCLKILMDVLEGIVYENDYTVLPRIQSVEYDKENPRVEVVMSNQTDIHRKNAQKILKI